MPELESKCTRPAKKIVIVGGGIAGIIKAYRSYIQAKSRGEKIQIVIHEKNKTLSETTIMNIGPSLTPDEMLSVVPRGPDLIKFLEILFNQPNGIKVPDVAQIAESQSGKEFVAAAFESSKDEKANKELTETLLKLGKRSMEEWQRFYDEGDDRIKAILKKANFIPCKELSSKDRKLQDGYRIDLIYGVQNAKGRAEGMKADYEKLGYQNCNLLTPSEVKALDPSVTNFCEQNSKIDPETGGLIWKEDACAIFRPGGCFDASTLLPELVRYLQEEMGTFVNENGAEENCFAIKFDHEVTGVALDKSQSKITGLEFKNSKEEKSHSEIDSNQDAEYVFCPGEAVGTLRKLGFEEPAHARFAGPSLTLEIPADKFSAAELAEIENYNHCMEVHKVGVVLAWQGRYKKDENKIYIRVAGTKAFYADQTPHKNEAFCKERNLLQLQMINDILPQFVTKALGKNTKGDILTQEDLAQLEAAKIASRWVGSRAVYYDGAPVLGKVKVNGAKDFVTNASLVTGLGSGGGSNCHGANFVAEQAKCDKPDALAVEVLTRTSSVRTMFNGHLKQQQIQPAVAAARAALVPVPEESANHSVKALRIV